MTDLSANEALVKTQFDRQARNFDDWPITQDDKLLGAFFDFAGFNQDDNLLEVGCGTGTFSVYAAHKVKEVCGLDVSAGMIAIANQNAQTQGRTNVKFFCQSGVALPFASGEFSVVSSKSAFHHMQDYRAVFSEMARVCRVGGKICLQDIVAYEEAEIDDYFEALEKAIDISHYKTLSKRNIFDLFKANDFQIKRLFENSVELDLQDYIDHAVQDGEERAGLTKLVEKGLNQPKISDCFFEMNGRLKFKRKIFIITGIKQN